MMKRRGSGKTVPLKVAQRSMVKRTQISFL